MPTHLSRATTTYRPSWELNPTCSPWRWPSRATAHTAEGAEGRERLPDLNLFPEAGGLHGKEGAQHTREGSCPSRSRGRRALLESGRVRSAPCRLFPTGEAGQPWDQVHEGFLASPPCRTRASEAGTCVYFTKEGTCVSGKRLACKTA